MSIAWFSPEQAKFALIEVSQLPKHCYTKPITVTMEGESFHEKKSLFWPFNYVYFLLIGMIDKFYFPSDLEIWYLTVLIPWASKDQKTIVAVLL